MVTWSSSLSYLVLLLFWGHFSYAQVNWISFEQLEDSLTKKPKKVFVNFYADWCAYCKKMDGTAFKDPQISRELNTNYYAVKMNAESKDSIVFGGKIFFNRQLGRKRNPTHEIPLLLGSREDRPFTLPVILVLDEKFQILERYFEYMSPKKMKEVLKI